MFREIRTRERNLEETRKAEENMNYKKIKPETDMTMNELEDFWASEFGMM